MKKLSCRLTDQLYKAVWDKLLTSNYTNLSELIRDLLRRWVELGTIEIPLTDIEMRWKT